MKKKIYIYIYIYKFPRKESSIINRHLSNWSLLYHFHYYYSCRFHFWQWKS